MSRRDPLLPLIDNDGGGVLLLGYGLELAKLGHDVDIYTSLVNEGWGEIEYIRNKRAAQSQPIVHINDKVRVIRKEVEPIDATDGFNSFDHKVLSSIVFSNAFDSDELSGYDIVNICHPTTGYGLLQSHKIDRSKTVLFPMLLSVQYDKYRHVPSSYTAMGKYVLDNVDLILCASREEENDSIELGADIDKLHLVVRGVDLQVFNGRLREQCASPVNIVSVGAIREQKNYMMFVEIAKILSASNINFTIKIVGDNVNFSYDDNRAYYEKMVQKIDEEGLSNKVLFVGGMRQDELSKSIDDADIAVFPSTSESFGKAMLETIASGLPTILSSSVGAYDIFAKDSINAILAKPNAKDFCHAITTLINNQVLYHKLSRCGLETARGFTWEAVTRDLSVLYVKILKEKK